LVDLKPKGLLGTQAEKALEMAGITCNKNPIPLDPSSPNEWRGLRFGTAAGTTRRMGVETFPLIGNLIADILDTNATGNPDLAVLKRVQDQVKDICQYYPSYPTL
jgi:glycine hydroxymethyltransferase